MQTNKKITFFNTLYFHSRSTLPMQHAWDFVFGSTKPQPKRKERGEEEEESEELEESLKRGRVDFYIPVSKYENYTYVRASTFWYSNVFVEKEAIACGTYGCVHVACTVKTNEQGSDKKICGVVKLGEISNREVALAIYAADRQFGPRLLVDPFTVPTYEKTADGLSYEIVTKPHIKSVAIPRNPALPNQPRQYYDLPVRKRTQALVMEQFSTTLDSYFIDRETDPKIKALPLLEAQTLSSQLRLLYLEQKRALFVHGDLHANNLLIRWDENGVFRVVLADFGYSMRFTSNIELANRLTALDWLIQLSSLTVQRDNVQPGILYRISRFYKQAVDRALFRVLFEEIFADYQNIQTGRAFRFEGQEYIFADPAALKQGAWPLARIG